MLMGSLLVARFLHPLGIYAKPGTLQFSIGRVGGMVVTTIVMVACALLMLRQVCLVDDCPFYPVRPCVPAWDRGTIGACRA
jgi:hypothetical protein